MPYIYGKITKESLDHASEPPPLSTSRADNWSTYLLVHTYLSSLNSHPPRAQPLIRIRSTINKDDQSHVQKTKAIL